MTRSHEEMRAAADEWQARAKPLLGEAHRAEGEYDDGDVFVSFEFWQGGARGRKVTVYFTNSNEGNYAFKVSGNQPNCDIDDADTIDPSALAAWLFDEVAP